MKERQEGLIKVYQDSADIISCVGENIFNLNISLQTKNTWRNMMGVIKRLDDVVDSEKNYKKRFAFEKICLDFIQDDLSDINKNIDYIAVFGYKNIYSLNNLRSDIKSFPIYNQNLFLNTLEHLCVVSENLKHTADINEYAKKTKIEGQLAGRLFTSLIRNPEDNSKDFFNFENYLTSLSAVGNIFDNIIDFDDDFKTGKTIIYPSNKNKLILWRSITSELKEVLSKTDSKLLKKLFFSSCSAYVEAKTN